MAISPVQIDQYRTFMSGLDPNGPPRAHIVRRATEGVSPRGGRLGILDASFNPMTRAHVQMVTEACRTCALDETLLMLSRANVDKDVSGAHLGRRLAMLLTYAKAHPEHAVAGCSHAKFVDKAEALKPHYPPGTRFYFILGYDTLLRLFDPKYYADMSAELDRLFAACHIICANRDNRGRKAMQAFMGRSECAPYASRVHFIHLEPALAALSSTQVRRRIQRGQPADRFVPSEIAAIIQDLNLYQNPEP